MFSNKAFAKVWEVKENNGVKTIRISTSRKNQQGEYEQDFSGFVRVVGKAKDFPVSEGDNVQLLSVGVTTKYDAEKKVTYTNYTCFELGVANSSGSSKPASSSSSAPASSDDSGFMNIPDGIDEELPFN